MNKNKKVVLCKLNETYCPSVEFQFDGSVTIGEDANTVKLTGDQWNLLVGHIKSGNLDKI